MQEPRFIRLQIRNYGILSTDLWKSELKFSLTFLHCQPLREHPPPSNKFYHRFFFRTNNHSTALVLSSNIMLPIRNETSETEFFQIYILHSFFILFFSTNFRRLLLIIIHVLTFNS